jgi:hypothetical protein
MRIRTLLPRVALSAAFLLPTLTLPACQTPEERAMDQMEDAMRTNTRMMKRMQKMM